MLSLHPMQRAIDMLYRLELSIAVDDYVRPMPVDGPDAARREVVLVSQSDDDDDEDPVTEIAVLLDDEVKRALRGEHVPGLSRFHAWCMALEGVSHFVLLAFRAENDRPVSLLELELQAEVDKFAVALIDRVLFRGATEAHAASRRLRLALFDHPTFLDPVGTLDGARYRLAHRLASGYASSLERRYVRDGKLERMIDELREFYRAGFADKLTMACAA